MFLTEITKFTKTGVFSALNNSNKIYLIGININSEKRNIDDYVIENFN
ncbi:hypothetical protein JCM30566_09100 [Marinitoga arctica]